VLVSWGLFVPARTHFLRQKTTPKPQRLERTWGNTDIQSDPPGFASEILPFLEKIGGGPGLPMAIPLVRKVLRKDLSHQIDPQGPVVQNKICH
jgi:hypothetical protein